MNLYNTDEVSVEQVRTVANGIRRRVLEHTILNKGGYLSQACSSAEIFAVLYTKILKLSKLKAPIVPKPFPGVPGPLNKDYFTGESYHGEKGAAYDRFYLSPSQYSLVMYTALIEVGRMSENGLSDFNKDGSSLEMIGAEHSPGMGLMGGSLGQCISQAAGIALSRKLKGEEGRVFVFLSDGECQSGQFWEAVQCMAYHKLDNMVMYVDVNGYQCDGKTSTVMNLEPFDKRLEAFGARVFRVHGHDIERLAALGKQKPDGRPLFILADTCPYKGIGILKTREPKFHYVRFTKDEEIKDYHLALEKMK
ncbi:UNVERIFIED_CONTAM: transketolase [Acetivibrio alkalicellulosi]